MEKNSKPENRLKRIWITGPESTGKSELARELANHFGGICIEEYARDFVGNLNRPYTYNDVVHVAEHQWKSYLDNISARKWLFFDTWLIITKVWMKVVFERVPEWIDQKLREARFDLVLVCNTDIPWVADPLRENGGDMREKLLTIYLEELDYYKFPWKLVSGTGTQRVNHALEQLQSIIGDGAI